MRRKTKKITYGNVDIGGCAPISVQSMTNTDTRDIEATVKQIKLLEEVGCDLVRVAVLDSDAALSIEKIKKKISIPIIADIHFDYKLALQSIKSGVDGLRINPGNIGDRSKVEEVVKACKERSIPIRIGVNSGSISNEILKRFNGVNVDSMVHSAMEHINILEDLNYNNIKVSLKATDIGLTIESYKKISKMIDYPFHIGITEAGTIWAGTIKSSVGIGTLLNMGLGDTLRVSLTGNPVEEVKVGKQILRTLGLLKDKIEIISCPTCGRTQIDLIRLANKVEKELENISKPIKVAIMGCAVNGPGEAKEADIGVAGGTDYGLIFRKGKVIKRVKEDEIICELISEINKL